MSVYKVKPFLGDGSSKTEIVDALPAEGVEGQTYLLRKTNESSVFKAHYYNIIYAKLELSTPNILVGEGDIAVQLQEALEKKLDPSLGEDVVDFSQFIPPFETFSSEEEFEQALSRYNVIFVQTEADVLAIDHEVDAIIQDLGEIGVEDFNISEFINNSETTYLAIIFASYPSTLDTEMDIVKDNQIYSKHRSVQFNSEPEPGDTLYSFTEWYEDVEAQLVGTLTDTYEYNPEVLQALTPEDGYHITLTPEVPTNTYSYTQYVFDKGVYTEVSGKSESEDNSLTFSGYWLNAFSMDPPEVDWTFSGNTETKDLLCEKLLRGESINVNCIVTYDYASGTRNWGVKFNVESIQAWLGDGGNGYWLIASFTCNSYQIINTWRIVIDWINQEEPRIKIQTN